MLRQAVGWKDLQMNLAFGDVLKSWRTRRRLSQLELGLSADVSSRHISFLETGRSRPSRTMVMRLCDQLDIPRAVRNQLLSAAGLAPAYEERALSADDMGPVRAAVDWMLERHGPYPAFAVDRHWHLVAMNTSSARLLAGMQISFGDSMITALLENEILRGAIVNLDEVQHHAAARLRTESAHLGGDPVLDAAVERLTDSNGHPHLPEPGVLPAVIPTRYRVGDQVLSLFSTIAQFGTAEDIALSDLKIEMLFPADDATRQVLQALDAG